MNCPKCKTQISDRELVCPKCKKVLKLQCHTCGAVTKNTVCEKCGTVILNKCYKCGKLNSTTLEKCPNCGLDINASIGLRESVIEEFAALTIEITNFDDIKNAFKSDKIMQKFKRNFYGMIKKAALQKKLRVQFIENTFIIRFCKDYTFAESCKSAIDFSIYIAQTVTELNKKLFDVKGVELKTQMAIQKRDIYSKTDEYKAGININVVYSSTSGAHRFHNTEVIVDSYIYQSVKTQYPFQSLSAAYVKNQMVMFFELMLHKIIKEEKEKIVDINNVVLPQNIDYEPEEELSDAKLINFASISCTFLKANQQNLLGEIEKISNKNITNPIISVKSSARLGKLSLISTEQLQNIFADCRIIRLTCPKYYKYTAFGLFKQMLLYYNETDNFSAIFNTSIIDSTISDRHLKDLFKMQINEQNHPEDWRYTYFEAFSKFILTIPYKTLFVIEDFDNIDEGSLDILKYIFENYGYTSNVGFLISYDENYSLHRKIYKLMTAQNYFEIELKPSSNKIILQKNINKLKDIQKSFFIEKILENTKGSLFYFNAAIDYLIDNGVLEYKDNKYKIGKERMVVIPKVVDELFQKRLSYLQVKENAYELFISLLLIGPKMPVSILQNTGFQKPASIIKYLEERNFITLVNDKEILINNYNLYRNNILNTDDKAKIESIAKNLLEKIYINIKIPDTTKAEVLEFANLKKEAFAQWHTLAMISSQIGDFSAYLNCTNRFLSLVENVIDADADRTVEQIKTDVYTELAALMYKYYPDKILNSMQILLTKFEAQNDDNKIKEIANKLVQICLMSGNYNNALEYVGKLISRTPKGSFNPNSKNFNLNYFLINLVTLEIYFNLGRLNECVELGDEVFRYIDINTLSETILPEGFSKKQFEDALLDGLFFISISRVIQLKDDTMEYLQKLSQSVGKKYSCFDFLILLKEFLAGKNIAADLSKLSKKKLDKYSEILLPVLKSLVVWKNQDWENFGNYIYDAKLKSAFARLHQIESFCDLMIGMAYQNLSNTKKSKQIFYNILDISEERGLKNITYLSWLLIAESEFKDGNSEMAVGLVNNAILNIESDSNAGDYFTLMFKMLSAEILLNLKIDFEQVLFSLEQAFDIAYKKQLFVYMPKIANMLMYVYNIVINSQQDAATLKLYNSKIENLKRIMSQIS